MPKAAEGTTKNPFRTPVGSAHADFGEVAPEVRHDYQSRLAGESPNLGDTQKGVELKWVLHKGGFCTFCLFLFCVLFVAGLFCRKKRAERHRKARKHAKCTKARHFAHAVAS